MKFQIPAPLVRPALKLQKHSPKMMLGVGVVGVVTAGVMACRSTLKLSEALDPTEKMIELAHQKAELDASYAEGEYKKDIVKLQIHTVLKIAKLYAPAIAVAAVSISLITAAHVVQSRRAAAMTAAYAGLKEGYDKLRENVREKYGVEEEAKLRHGVEIVEETVEGKDGKLKTVKHEKAAGYSAYAKLFNSTTSTNWVANPDNNWFFLTSQQRYLNEKLQVDGVVFLNDAYTALGLPRTKAGQVVGWAMGESHKGDGYIDFGISDSIQSFFTSGDGSIWLDFNVDGEVLNLL